jgi:hypothetical protein
MPETSSKPPLPANPLDPFPRIAVDTSEDSTFDEILQLAVFSANHWTFGPDGPHKKPLTGSDTARGQIREALLHLLELGLIDIDEKRLNAASMWPSNRDPEEAS